MSYTHSGRVGAARYITEPYEGLVHTDFSSTGAIWLSLVVPEGETAWVDVTGSAAEYLSQDAATWVRLQSIGDGGVVTGSDRPVGVLIPENPFTGIRVLATAAIMVEVTQA